MNKYQRAIETLKNEYDAFYFENKFGNTHPEEFELLSDMQGRCGTRAELRQNSKIWQQVKDMPSADVAPVRHGKWIDRNGTMVAPFWERYECSECGARSDNSKYCHNCGAKMDEERKEE